MDVDDRLGPFQAALEAGNVLAGLGQLRFQRVGGSHLRPALERLQRLKSAGVALPAPVGQGGRGQTFPAQDGGDPAGVRCPIRFGKNAQLLRRREGPAFRTGRQFRGGCRRRSNNPRFLTDLRDNASSGGWQGRLVGHDHAMSFLRPRA